MTLYYRDATVQVTSDVLQIGGQRIPIGELTYVWHAKGPGSTRARAHLLGRGVLIFLFSVPPLLAVICVLSLVYAAQDRGDWKLAGLIIAGGVVGALALTPFLELPLGWLDRSYDTGGAQANELWVQYQGQEVMLLSTTDGLRFGQIYRAVQRAIEQHG